MEQKKYIKIQRLKEENMRGFKTCDRIVVQEKIDGANFSVKYDEDTDSILAFSRNFPLSENNTLSGAWDWAQRLDKEAVKEALGTNLILFGEWLVQHVVEYPEDRYGKAYFYDVLNADTEEYLEQDEVEKIVKKLGLIYVPVFYRGEFESWEHLMQFVGKTDLGGEKGEGIVVKNMTRINDKKLQQPWYTKIVSAEYSETAKVFIKPMSAKMEKKLERAALVKTIVTEVRVKKLILKMADEGVIPADWNSEHLPIIKKNIGKAIYDDCISEEPETMEKIGKNFSGMFFAVVMEIVEDIVDKRS